MISIVYQKYGLSINAVWFCEDVNEAMKKSKADIVFFHGVELPGLQSGISDLQHTLISDLREPSENLYKLLSKNYRYEINRVNKENVTCEVFEADVLKKKPEVLNTFKREYEDFTRLKGIPSTYNVKAMEKYIENGNVILTKVFKDKEDYAQHVYVSDGKIARLLYSVSNFRTEGIDRNLIGRANKYLHWFDIQYLQKYKLQTLDWGGISSLSNPNGVDRFKKEFGGYERKHYNIILGKSMLGRLAIFAMKVKRG